MTKLTKRDIEMLKLTAQMETPLVAQRLGMTEEAINARFYWLRKKREENQTFVNQLNNFERTCPRLKKRLTSGEGTKNDN